MIRHLFFTLLCLGMLSPVFGSDLVSYQGKLTDAAGDPLPTGQYWLGFRIWDHPTESNDVIWARQYQEPVVEGSFSLLLGADGTAWDDLEPLTDSLKLATVGGNRWLEVTVLSDADSAQNPSGDWQVLLPRQSLNTVPYAMNGVPSGTVAAFIGSQAPEGWVLAEGQLLETAMPEHQALFAVIGYTFGQAASPDQFRLPDLRGRTIIGSGQGADLTNRLVGESLGAETHTLSLAEMPEHNHNVRDTGHSHSTAMRYGGWGTTNGFRGWYGTYGGQVSTTSSTAKIVQDNRGSNQPHNNMQPSVVLTYIIKL